MLLKRYSIYLTKISHSFTTLKDPEKKTFYDKYGTEEEFREKYAQQHQNHQYDEDEMDPFDLFEMFFTGGNMNGNVFRQRGGRMYRRPQPTDDPEFRRANQRVNPQMNRNVMIVQLLPFLILILFSVVPYLFNTVILYLLLLETCLPISKK